MRPSAAARREARGEDSRSIIPIRTWPQPLSYLVERCLSLSLPRKRGQGRQAGGPEAQGNQSLLCCRPLRARLAPHMTIPTQPFRLSLSKAPVWSSPASASSPRPGRGRRLVAHACSPLAGLQACAAPAGSRDVASLRGSPLDAPRLAGRRVGLVSWRFLTDSVLAAGFPPSTRHPAAASGNPPGPSRALVGSLYPASRIATHTVLQHPLGRDSWSQRLV